MLQLEIYKRHAKGAATYIAPGTRARVIVSRKMFSGDAPDTVEFNAGNIAEPTEKDLKKAERMKARGENAQHRSVNLEERLAKTKAKAEKLEKQLAAQKAKQSTSGTSDAASSLAEATA